MVVRLVNSTKETFYKLIQSEGELSFKIKTLPSAYCCFNNEY